MSDSRRFIRLNQRVRDQRAIVIGMNDETIGGRFAWFSDFTKELCNVALNNELVIPT